MEVTLELNGKKEKAKISFAKATELIPLILHNLPSNGMRRLPNLVFTPIV